MVYLKDLQGNIYTTNTVELMSLERECHTTKNPSKGKFYYEMTHLSGQNYHHAGFKYDNMAIYAYRCANEHTFYLIYQNTQVIEADNIFDDMSFTDVQPDSTIGLAFDTSSNIFSIFYKNQVKRYTIKSERKWKKVTSYLFEGADVGKTYKDTVKVNFGEENFVYSLPYGYIPWSKSTVASCKNNKRFRTGFCLSIFFLTC